MHCLTLCDSHSFKGAKLLARTYCRCHEVGHIDLHHFFTVIFTGICNADRHLHLIVSEILHHEVRVCEISIAQAVTERVKGIRRHLNIIMALRELLVVVYRHLTCIIRDRNRKAACRIILAEKHIGKTFSTLLSRIELREKGISILLRPLLVERTALDVHHYHRCSGLLHSFKKLILKSEKIQACAVEAFASLHIADRVLVSYSCSCLLICSLEVSCARTSDDNHCDISLACCAYSLCYRIVPGITDCASLHICHILFSDLCLDSVKHSTDVLTWLRSGIVTKLIVHIVGIRSDDSHLHVLVQRKHTVILQKDNTLACSLTGHSNVLIASYDTLCCIRIHIRIVEQSKVELEPQHPCYSLIENLGAYLSGLDSLLEQCIAIRSQVHIHSGIHCHNTCIFLISCDMMVAEKSVNTYKVRHDKAVKAPVLLEHTSQKFRIACRRHSVNRII